MELLQSKLLNCPYCGEPIEFLIDCSVQEQEYIEDCTVCCRPIDITVNVQGDIDVTVKRQDD